MRRRVFISAVFIVLCMSLAGCSTNKGYYPVNGYTTMIIDPMTTFFLPEETVTETRADAWPDVLKEDTMYSLTQESCYCVTKRGSFLICAITAGSEDVDELVTRLEKTTNLRLASDTRLANGMQTATIQALFNTTDYELFNGYVSVLSEKGHCAILFAGSAASSGPSAEALQYICQSLKVRPYKLTYNSGGAKAPEDLTENTTEPDTGTCLVYYKGTPQSPHAIQANISCKKAAYHADDEAVASGLEEAGEGRQWVRVNLIASFPEADATSVKPAIPFRALDIQRQELSCGGRVYIADVQAGEYTLFFKAPDNAEDTILECGSMPIYIEIHKESCL